jgi:hypothetical protein
MNLATSRNFVAALVVAGAALAPGLAAHAAPAAGTATDIKAAARARLAQTEPTLVIDHIEVRSIKDDYALAVAYPDLAKNETDPGTIILHMENGVWKGVGGPGTAFPPGDDREGAPDLLFDYDNPYTGDNAQNALNRITVAHKTYSSNYVQFEYPADGVIDAESTPSKVTLLGPKVREPIFDGPAYEITIQPLNVQTTALDEWGVARMEQEIAEREAENGKGGPNTQPQFATYFHLERPLGNYDAFQIDWFGGDSTQRELFLAPQGGGPIVQIATRVYPVQNNPGAPQAESAVNLLLRTLEVPTYAIQQPGMPRTGAGLDLALPALVLVLAAGTLALGTALRRRAAHRA